MTAQFLAGNSASRRAGQNTRVQISEFSLKSLYKLFGESNLVCEISMLVLWCGRCSELQSSHFVRISHNLAK